METNSSCLLRWARWGFDVSQLTSKRQLYTFISKISSKRGGATTHVLHTVVVRPIDHASSGGEGGGHDGEVVSCVAAVGVEPFVCFYIGGNQKVTFCECQSSFLS